MQHFDDGRLQAWLDRDRSGLGADEAAEIERHVAGCDACQARVAELEALDERSRSIFGAAAPAEAEMPDFASVVERSRRGSQGAEGGGSGSGRAGSGRAGSGRFGGARPRRLRPWMAAGWAASLVAAVGLGWLTNDLIRADRTARPPAAETEADALSAEPDPGAAVAGPEPDAAAGEPGGPGSAGADAAGAGVRERAEAAAQRSLSEAQPPDEAVQVLPGQPPLAEPPVLVRGRVTDEEGAPVPSVQVSASGAGVGGVTGEDGTFSFPLPASAAAPGTDELTLTARGLGFHSETRAVPMAAGDTVTADFRLPRAALALESVVVTGPRAPSGPVAAADRAPGEQREEPVEWDPVSRAEAEGAAGFPLLTVPELDVLGIEVAEAAGVVLVRVHQPLPSGAVLTLVQQRHDGPRATGPDAAVDTLALSIRRDEILVTGSAPIAADSLRALLARVR